MNLKVPCIRNIMLIITLMMSINSMHSQELNARVSINHSQIEGTKTSIFEGLQKSITEFLNERRWTNMQFSANERINCSMNIAISQYDEAYNKFTCVLTVQSTRPIFNSSYTSTVYNMRDANFNFNYQEFDRLEFRETQIDNNLTAMLAYYAYLLIGFDLDTMSPKGGTTYLQMAENIVTNSQNLGETGWRAFDDSKNRFAIINDYMDGLMEPYRLLQYEYHRNGLDKMSDDVEQGRANITESIKLLQRAHEDKPMSLLPQIFTDYKRDELVNIYKGKGSNQEKEDVYNTVFRINASQNNHWLNIKK